MPTKREAVANEWRDRIVIGLHVGRLRGGSRLPPVRQIAAEHRVNARVVLGALRTLAREELVELRPRSGAYVIDKRTQPIEEQPHMSAWLVDIMLQAREHGLRPRSLADFVRRGADARRIHAACIECNADQLHLLCSELSDDYGFYPESTPLHALRGGQIPTAVRDAAVLITTAFHADEVRRLATKLGKPMIAVTLRPEIMRDVARHLRAGPVYYVATDHTFEPKLRRMLAPFGPTKNLHVLILPRDDLTAIPEHAATYIMPSAREHIRRRSAVPVTPGRPIEPARHFSEESARELLRFAVRVNLGAPQ
jgi:DNA-binding transcriptional regulator YhcF (GntR family)